MNDMFSNAQRDAAERRITEDMLDGKLDESTSTPEERAKPTPHDPSKPDGDEAS